MGVACCVVLACFYCTVSGFLLALTQKCGHIYCCSVLNQNPYNQYTAFILHAHKLDLFNIVYSFFFLHKCTFYGLCKTYLIWHISGSTENSNILNCTIIETHNCFHCNRYRYNDFNKHPQFLQQCIKCPRFIWVC